MKFWKILKALQYSLLAILDQLAAHRRGQAGDLQGEKLPATGAKSTMLAFNKNGCVLILV